MTENFIVSLGQQCMLYVIKMVAPILLMSLVMGIGVSIFQASTQINEQTMTFIPKIIAIIITLLVFGPWMLTTSVDFTKSILENLMTYVS
ncbi:flagellar biosynthesis protein FliQ [Alicyclobacillus ferrooxydans]|uniref:Flagellar biosynthetic protein FliQ n=1 Tax=Alicyclobacillus ferrooxydans TaxID=471514 RepID=A0A0P9CFN8_9BACL|nr:flagellar biosynthesis protein FliQ [Alicyclobacillus ferrooxydans]KPV44386.1 flagellar biosynthesis protein FliQ [Alicyclobacillus ferrooxydans]